MSSFAHSRFYWLRDTENLRRLADWDDGVHTEQIVCAIDPGHQRGGRRSDPLRVVLPSKIDDVVWTWGNECLLQDRMLKQLNEAGFTGFETKPVIARFGNSDKEAPTLHEFIVTGWGGMAAKQSGIRLVRACTACGALRYSAAKHVEDVVDPSQWDGSDFFIVWPLPGYIRLSQRAAEFIKKSNFTGCRIVDKMEHHTDVIGGYSPGRLSYWMPVDRATEIGGPLGIV